MRHKRQYDENGVLIKNFKVWRGKFPAALYFDSLIELDLYKRCKALKIPLMRLLPEEHSIELQEKFTISAISNAKNRKIFTSTVRPITYTPDFLITIHDKKFYIEVKGFFEADARLRYKLFQHHIKDDKRTEIYLINDAKDVAFIVDYFYNLMREPTTITQIKL
jgi:predicted nuclease of restriction endonuclease-like RecB superfamily